MDWQTELADCLNQHITKELNVGLSGKDDLAVVAAQNDVLWMDWDDIAGKACHETFPSAANPVLGLA